MLCYFGAFLSFVMFQFQSLIVSWFALCSQLVVCVLRCGVEIACVARLAISVLCCGSLCLAGRCHFPPFVPFQSMQRVRHATSLHINLDVTFGLMDLFNIINCCLELLSSWCGQILQSSCNQCTTAQTRTCHVAMASGFTCAHKVSVRMHAWASAA